MSIKEVNPCMVVEGGGIVRIPVTLPEGHRMLGSGFCINITEISFKSSDAALTAANWTGYPFISMKR